ncbi:pLS20_p028 family conjugation system transmembrane protein [Leuconostoc suionicum]|uniref:pLS20_p028 family conjugation system transmembrane protein n=1 Tax=Leuconostoc suionicum TaxID=1511761 RepID=UPI0032DF38CD
MTNLFSGLNTLAGSLPTLPNNGPTADFYNQWSQYLSPLPHIFLTLIMLFMHSIALIFYYIANAVFSAYQSSFKLLDFMNIFFEPNSDVYRDWNLGNILKDFLYLGFVIFGIMMMVQWIQYTATSGRKGREWPKGITITVAVITALPWAIGLMSGIGTATVNDTSGTKDKNIVTQLWQGNSTNLKELAKNNFDLSKYKNQHVLTNDQIEGSDFHSVMSDAGYTDGLSDAQKSVFTKKIGGNGNMVDITGDSLVLGKTFADDYPVMKTNWLGIIGGEIVFIIVVAGAIVRLLSSVYKMAFMAGSIVYFGLRDGTQGKRVQQVLGMIEGQITGIVMMPISLIFFFAWVEFAFNTINGLGLDMWPFTILSIAALLAGGKGLAGGFEMIEQWTGVRSGHNPVASMMLANQAAHMVGGATRVAKKNIGKGLNAISPEQKKKNRELGKKIANSGGNQGLDNSKALTEHSLNDTGVDASAQATGKAAKAAEVAGRTVGAMKHPGSLLKNTGRAAGDKVKGGVNKAVGNVKDYAGGVADNFAGGQQAVEAFNKRHSPVTPKSTTADTSSNSSQPRNVHEALSKAATDSPNSHPKDTTFQTQSNMSHAMSDAHRGLPTGTNSTKPSATSSTKPIVSGGTVVQPKGVGATPATMSRRNTPRLSGTLPGKKTVTQPLTTAQQKEKDRAWAESVIAKQKAKMQNQQNVSSKEDK